MENLLILGAGGFGSVIQEAARASGQYKFISYLDDAAHHAIGKCNDYLLPAVQARYKEAYPAFGNNSLREEWVSRLLAAGYTVPVLIHQHAYVSPSAELGAGTVVLPSAVVNAKCKIGRGCIINIGALVDHDCVLEDGVHIAPGAVLKSSAYIEAREKVESGMVIGNAERRNTARHRAVPEGR